MTQQNHPEILVIGNSLPETILTAAGQHGPQLGGVGALMAQTLASLGAAPHFLTPVARYGSESRQLHQLLAQQAFPATIIPSGEKPAWSRIDRRRSRLQGCWPSYQWGELRAAVTEAMNARSSSNAWVMVDCSLESPALAAIARLAVENNWQLAVNGTTRQRCRRILAPGIAGRPIALLTLNRTETESLLPNGSSRQQVRAFMKQRSIAWLLTTQDRDGWTLYGPDNSEISAPAAQRPAWGSHTIGCGDAASAGLLYALATGQTPKRLINYAVGQRLDHNAKPGQPLARWAA